MTGFVRLSVAVLTMAAAISAQAAEPVAAQGAGVPTNPLGQCMVAKTTGEDRIAVARWMLAALVSAPKVADLSNVDTARKTAADKGMADVFTRLVTVDCADLARPLLLARDKGAFETAGGTLGEIAVKELLTDPKATAALTDYVKLLDWSRFEAFLKQKP